MVETLELTLRTRRALTGDITEFTFLAAGDVPLPPFKAGAHLSVQTPSGAWRSYSISNDDTDRDRYVIAVKREETGRGGSLSMHRDLQEGARVNARPPRNAFELRDAPRYLLIAGGIGITPILSMLRRLRREGRDVKLVYLTRSRDLTAYGDFLTSAEMSEHVLLHHDNGDRAQTYDFWDDFQMPDDRHIYYCGPRPMMDAIYLQTIHWPRSQIHAEDFGGVSAQGAQAAPFRLRRASTDEVFDVPADKSILDVLRDQGIAFASSCESGTCGTCRMRLIAGEVNHRDLFLREEERASSIMPCVSRAAGEEITLVF